MYGNFFWKCSCPEHNVHSIRMKICDVCETTFFGADNATKEDIKAQVETLNCNHIAKGMLVYQRNGWTATVIDNKSGLIRGIECHGENGSMYAFDMLQVKVWDDDETAFFADVYVPANIAEKRAIIRGVLP